MATILAHITVKSGCEAEFEELAKVLYRDSHATEHGLLRYEYWRGQQVGRYYTLLSFRSYGDFISHQVSPHHEEASARLGAVISGLRLEWLDPVQGASDLPPTRDDPMTDSTDPQMLRAARLFPVEMGSWWPVAGADSG